MPVVTALNPQRRKPDRVSVFLDGAFVAGLPADLADRMGLEPGRELTAAEVAEVRAASELGAAYERSIKYLRARRRSRREVEIRLARYGYDAAVIQAITETLTGRGLLDDAAFAAGWIRDRAAVKPKGKKAVRAELLRKGVAAPVVEEALATYYVEDEEVAARRALASRVERLRARGPIKGRSATYGFLGRRGFSGAVARRLADEVFNPATGI